MKTALEIRKLWDRNRAFTRSDLLLFSLQSNFKKVCGRKYEKCPSTKIMVGKKKKTTAVKKKGRALTWISIFARRQKHI